MEKIKVKKIRPGAMLPLYATEGSAGFDFYAAEDIVVPGFPGETVIVPTGLKMEIPRGYELQIRPRSGMSLRTNLMISNAPGTVDSDYRGEVGILVQNLNRNDYQIKRGDRIAQGVLNKVPQAKFIEVNELSDTERGSGGYGHTGDR